MLIRLITLLVLAGVILDVQAGAAVTPPEGLSASEWADIRRQIEAPKYQARESSDGYQAQNPAQAGKLNTRPTATPASARAMPGPRLLASA